MPDQVGRTEIDDVTTLTMDVDVDEVIYSESKTHIRLKLGHEIFLSFVIPVKVEVPEFIHFTSKLRRNHD